MATRRVAILAGLLFIAWPLFQALPVCTASSIPVFSAQEMNFTLEGKITDKSAGKLTVSSGENIVFHVLYNEKTVIRKKDGSPGSAQDLHTGLRISVAGDLAESGEITAAKIDIKGEEPEKQ